MWENDLVCRELLLNPRLGKMKHFRVTAYIIFVSLIAGIISAPSASAAESYTNPISGFFIYTDTNTTRNYEKLNAIQAAGGDTVITFGNRLRPAGQNGVGQITTDGAVNDAFRDCLIDGVPCVTAMKRSYNIRSTFTYGDKSYWDGGALKCAGDRVAHPGGDRKTYTLLVIPTQDNGCSSPNGVYDLVVINNSWPSHDATTAIINGAAERGMSYITGLPAPVIDPVHGHLPNLSYLDTMEKFTDRFMLEYKSQHDKPSLRGFYHHFEQNLNSAWYETHTLYRMQNRMIAKHFGTSKLAMVSPYIDSRRSPTGAVPAQAAENAIAIANTAEGVPMAIAPQDGVGTGKGAAYYDTEAWAGVDPWSIPESGSGANANIHHAPTKHYYQAMRDALAPTGVQLWSNLEGMTASFNASNACTAGTARGATVKERLDKQVQMAGSYTVKNISFMWDHYFTCAPYGTSLGQELTWRKSDPIVTGAWSEGNNLVVIGYNLNPVKIDVVQGGFAVSGSPIEHLSDVGHGLQKAVFAQTDMGVKSSGNYLVTVTAVNGKASSLPSDLISPVVVPARQDSVPSDTTPVEEDPEPEKEEEEKPLPKKVVKGLGFKDIDYFDGSGYIAMEEAEAAEEFDILPKPLVFGALILVLLLVVLKKGWIRV